MIPSISRCVAHHKQCSWDHADQVTTYIQERQRQELEREEATGGYAAELAEYNANNTLITFKQWLIMGKRR